MSKVMKVTPELTEVELLKQQLAQLASQVELLTKSNNAKPKTTKKEVVNEDTTDVRPDTYVKVMSLINDPLNLNTEPVGKSGRTFRFDHFGEVKRILYADLQRIIENNSTFFNDFKFLIMDSRVIDKNGYTDLYEKALTKDKIELLFDPTANQTDAVNIFKSAGDKQREEIVNLMMDRMLKDYPMDLNFLRRLSDVIGYDIAEKFKKVKESHDSLPK